MVVSWQLGGARPGARGRRMVGYFRVSSAARFGGETARLFVSGQRNLRDAVFGVAAEAISPENAHDLFVECDVGRDWIVGTAGGRDQDERRAGPEKKNGG